MGANTLRKTQERASSAIALPFDFLICRNGYHTVNEERYKRFLEKEKLIIEEFKIVEGPPNKVINIADSSQKKENLNARFSKIPD